MMHPTRCCSRYEGEVVATISFKCAPVPVQLCEHTQPGSQLDTEEPKRLTGSNLTRR